MGANLTSRRRRRLPLLFILSLAMALSAGALLLNELVRFSQREAQLPAGITVAGINVSGLSEAAAVARWEQAYAQPIRMYYRDMNGEHPILLRPDQLGWRISSAPMLADALASGEADGGFWRRFMDYMLGGEQSQPRDIPLLADYQEDALLAFLNDLALRYDSGGGAPGYDLQTLTVFPGESGYALDIPAAMTAIDAALRTADSRTIALPASIMPNSPPAMNTLQTLLIDYLDSHGFIHDGQTTVASIFILDLLTGEEISLLGDVAYSAASAIKVPIMIDFYRALDRSPSPDEAWLLANSLLCSNNASSNLIMEIIGGDIFAGIQSVTNTAQYIGARNTYISAPFYLGVEGQQLGSVPAPATSPNAAYDTRPDPFNQTTAEDMGTLFSLLYDCAQFGSGLMTSYPNGQITPRECRQMLELMSANDIERLLQGGLPPDTRLSHKNGWIFDTVSDAGVVYSPNGRHYVIAVFLWEQTEFQDYEKLWPLIEAISRAAWNFFNPEHALLTPRANLPPTAPACEGAYLPPAPEQVDLNNINSWKGS